MIKSILSIIICCVFVSGACASDGLVNTGEVLEYAMPVGAFCASALTKDKTGVIQFVESFALASCLTYGLKYAVTETRPNGGSNSFPSGHTSATFCSAAYLDMRYGEGFGIPAYALAALTGWSRIEGGYHYSWDVAAGAVIGIVSSSIFTRKSKLPWKLVPIVDKKEYGAMLVWRL